MIQKIRLSALQKTLVVTFEEGLRLGRVHDVFLDRQTKRIEGIAFSHGLLGAEDKFYVDRAAILKLGRDVVIVSRQEDARPLTDEMGPKSLKLLKGRKVTTAEGAFIGDLTDITVHRENGLIAEIHLTDDRAMEVDLAEISLGPDVIVVPTGWTGRIRHVEVEKTGVLERALDFTALPESLRHRYAELKESVNRSKGFERVVDSLKSGSEKTQEAVKRTSHKIQETIQQIRKSHETEDDARAAAEDPGEDQGREAEHAGKTFLESDPPPDPEADYACDSDRAVETDERCKRP